MTDKVIWAQDADDRRWPPLPGGTEADVAVVGAGIVGLLGSTDLAAAVYVGDDVTDLDAFRGLT